MNRLLLVASVILLVGCTSQATYVVPAESQSSLAGLDRVITPTVPPSSSPTFLDRVDQELESWRRVPKNQCDAEFGTLSDSFDKSLCELRLARERAERRERLRNFGKDWLWD